MLIRVLCVFMWVAAKDGFSKEVMERTQRHLDQYAREGLRTLCVAKKVCLPFSLPFSIYMFHLLTVRQTSSENSMH